MSDDEIELIWRYQPEMVFGSGDVFSGTWLVWIRGSDHVSWHRAPMGPYHWDFRKEFEAWAIDRHRRCEQAEDGSWSFIGP